MTVSASNIFSKPLDHMRTLLSHCESFQAWVGVTGDDLGEAAGIAAAAARIHLIEFAEDPTATKAARAATRPLVVIGWSGLTARPDREPAGYFHHEGDLLATFEQVEPAGDGISTQTDKWLTFANAVGSILEEAEGLSGTGTYLHLGGWRKGLGPGRVSETDEAGGELALYQVNIEFQWSEG